MRPDNTAPPDQKARTPQVRLDLFDASLGLDRGRSRHTEALWYLCKCLFFLSPLPWPSSLKRKLLTTFGARVGHGVVIKPRVNIHFPWKLSLGDHCWLGEECCLLNFEPITIGDHVCISQRAYLCGGNHDFRQPDFRYRNAPITVHSGAWIGACAFVAPGVTIGLETVVTSGSVVTRDMPDRYICQGNPCVARHPRYAKAV